MILFRRKIFEKIIQWIIVQRMYFMWMKAKQNNNNKKKWQPVSFTLSNTILLVKLCSLLKSFWIEFDNFNRYECHDHGSRHQTFIILFDNQSIRKKTRSQNVSWNYDSFFFFESYIFMSYDNWENKNKKKLRPSQSYSDDGDNRIA